MCLVISLDRLLVDGGSDFFYQETRPYGSKNKATDLPSFLEVDR